MQVQIEHAAVGVASRLLTATRDGRSPGIGSLASRLYLGRSDVTLVHGNIITERIHKVFALAHARGHSATVFEYKWMLERSLMPRILEPTFEGSLTTRRVSSPTLQDNLAAALLDLDVSESAAFEWEPAQTLVTQNDSFHEVNTDLWRDTQEGLVAHSVASRADVQWLVAMVATLPTDYAFDELSAVIFDS